MRIQETFTSKIRGGESSVSFISVCAEYHQQLVGLGDEERRLFSATPAPQQGVRLAVPIIDGNRVIVALIRQTVAVLQVHYGEEEFNAISCC